MRLFKARETVLRSRCARGLDVSVYQDWRGYDAARAAGYEFVFVKATQATTIVDEKWLLHIAAAKRAGFVVGGYHFAYPDGDPGDAKLEAQNFARALERSGGFDLGPVIDVETLGYEGEKLNDWVWECVEETERLTGFWCTTYTSPAYSKMLKLLRGWSPKLAWRPSWVAHWDSNPDTSPVWVTDADVQPNKYLLQYPTILDGFNAWDFWQFDAARTVPGFSGLVDRNLFNGTSEDLRAFAEFSRKPDLRRSWSQLYGVPEWRPNSNWQGVVQAALADKALS